MDRSNTWLERRIGEVIDGRFELVRLLGSGRQGAVYEALDRTTDGAVALKVLHQRWDDATSRTRLEREADALERLGAEGVARVVARAWDRNGLFCLATELLEGETLTTRFERHEREHRRMPDGELLDVLRQIAATLDRAHGRDLVHRDVKPSNVFLESNGGVKLLDFGYVRVLGATVLTAEGIVPGSPAYVAPESALSAKIDARADVYALGVLAFRGLSGVLPFDGRHAVELLERALRAPRPSLHRLRPDLPPEIDAFVERALAAEREDRFDGASALVDALAYVLSLEP